VIGQKIRKGILHEGAEVQLEIADIDIEDLDVRGSLIITTSNVMGHFNQDQELIYSNRTGKCQLHHVKIQNKGLIKQVHPKFWKNHWKREESVVIELGENAEFIAKNVVFQSSHHFKVPSNYRFEIYENDQGELECKKTPIHEARELWRYEIDPSYAIKLEKRHS